MRTEFRLRQTKTGTETFTKVFAPVNKASLRYEIILQLREELRRQTSAAETSRDEAISEESRAENKWDTHSQEAAYLAEGQAKLAMEIGANIELYSTLSLAEFTPADPISIGALVELEQGGSRTWYFIGPRAGGLEVSLEGRSVLVLTPQSPLGRQLIGKREGDTLQTAVRTKPALQRIVSVR